MLLSAVSVLVVAQSSSEIPEGLMNNSVYTDKKCPRKFLSSVSLICGFYYVEVIEMKAESDNTLGQ
jgi:hypothetical protein